MGPRQTWVRWRGTGNIAWSGRGTVPDGALWGVRRARQRSRRGGLGRERRQVGGQGPTAQSALVVAGARLSSSLPGQLANSLTLSLWHQTCPCSAPAPTPSLLLTLTPSLTLHLAQRPSPDSTPPFSPDPEVRQCLVHKQAQTVGLV